MDNRHGKWDEQRFLIAQSELRIGYWRIGYWRIGNWRIGNWRIGNWRIGFLVV